MGELAAPLLAAFGGGPGAAPTSVGVVPPENGMMPNMTQAVMGFPSVARGGMSEGGAIPGAAPAGGMTDEVAAVIQGFKPKKISFWGALGDQLLKHWGNEPAFSKRIQNKNLTRAMEGFTQDPLEAVRRIAQIPGMEGKAWELMNQIQDNTRADQAQGRLMGKDRESIIDRANRLFGSVQPDGSNWSTVRSLYTDIMRRNNINDVHLPEDFDPEVIAAQIAGGMKMSEQEVAKYRKANLDRMNRNTDSAIERREAQTQQGERRLDQADVREERIASTPKSSGKAPPKVVMTPGGNQMVIHPNGLVARMIKPDGTSVDLIKFGNGWKIRPPKEK